MIKKGTKVMVYDKTEGCPLSHVLERTSRDYPKKAPFYAWIKGVDNTYSGSYVIVYRKGATGGDYYKRSDFKTMGEMEMFSDKDFLL